MNKHQAYVDAIELAIRALDSAFVRANAAEVVRPLRPLSERWQMPPQERAAAERAEEANYDVAPEHWASRLALMSAFESLHASLRVISSGSAYVNPAASAWREAADRAREAARLAQEAVDAFEEASLPPFVPPSAAAAAEPTDDEEAPSPEESDELLSIR